MRTGAFSRWTARWLVGFLGILILTAGLLSWWMLAPTLSETDLSETEKPFEGSSSDLRQTVIVPTLDTPFPEGKSAVWCSSFQLAWKRLATDVVHEPPQIAGAEKVVERLNRAKQSQADVSSEQVYAVAGFLKDGILQRIRTEMAERFPDGPKPDAEASPDMVAFAYAYLKAGAKYKHPYQKNTRPFPFKESTGQTSKVESFGILPRSKEPQESLREQVEILFIIREADAEEPSEFALDLCKDSSPNQIVLAKISRKETLAETLDDLAAKASQPVPEPIIKNFRMFGTFLAPKMTWRIEHHFKELEGSDKPFLNPQLRGFYVGGALQTVAFRMDQDGATVTSDAKIIAKSADLPLDFNGPFLVYLKKRDANHPFFVMWLDNAEMLIKWP
jgi:hypothetical protein